MISAVCACSTSVILFVCTLFSALFGCVVFVSCSLGLMFSLGGGSVCVYVLVCAPVFFFDVSFCACFFRLSASLSVCFLSPCDYTACV